MSRPDHRVTWPGPLGWIHGARAFLRPNQRDAVAAAVAAMEGRGLRLMRYRRGVILADDVGMGKTFEALAACVIYLARRPRFAPPLILVPPALRHKWLDEMERFTSMAHHAAPAGRFSHTLDRLHRLRRHILFPTSAARRLAGSRLAIRVPLVILDEAHRARNRDSVLSRALARILRRNRRRGGPRFLFLTATPFQCDHYRDLINLLRFLDGRYDPDWPTGSSLADNRLLSKNSWPTAPSIVNAIGAGLKTLKRKVDSLVQEGSGEYRSKFADLLKMTDWNHDIDEDPAGITFGVHSTHDGLDEYLRALVVRSRKEQARRNPVPLELSAADTTFYLFGRAYLRSRARGAHLSEDPPPGDGFIPNAYSRLCSAHRALVRRLGQQRRGRHSHPHAQVLQRLANAESRGIVDHCGMHPKIRELVRRIATTRAAAPARRKTVVFFNHRLSLHQAKRVLQRVLAPTSDPALSPRHTCRPGADAIREAARYLQRHKWASIRLRLGTLLDDNELSAVRGAMVRHLASSLPDQRQASLRAWLGYFRSLLRSDGAGSISTSELRSSIRGQMEKPEGRASRRRLTSLRIRQWKPVEHLDGTMHMKQRERLLRSFNTPDVPPFILLVSQAGSEGQDMHGACRQVIHHDLHWNPTVMHQRTGRIYRDQVGPRTLRIITLEYNAGYDYRILEYAHQREAYKDFLLGERSLATFLDALRTEDRPPSTWHPTPPGTGWIMDLTPDVVG